MSNSQVDVHDQIAYMKSEILILNLLPNFEVFRSETSLNKLLETWQAELAKIYGLLCSRPLLSSEFPQFGPPTQSAAQMSKAFTLHICAAGCTVSYS